MTEGDSLTPERGYLSIGEVLSLLKPEFADLTISKIRFLESQGLLDPERTPSGYRKFYDQDVERLRWILRQQHEHYLPLKVIKGRLGSDPEGDEQDTPEEAAGRHPAAGAGDGREAGESDAVGNGTPPVLTAVPPAPTRKPLPADVAERLRAPDPFGTERSDVELTLEELAAEAELTLAGVRDLERFGLLSGRSIGGTTYYDDEAVVVARLAAAFLRFGVEPRHLKMYRTAAEREASFFEQVILPMVKQRNPQARRQAIETLGELGKLGHALRAAMLRQALKDYTS